MIAFAICLGGFLAAGAVAAGFLLRTADAHLWVKMGVPALMVALACYAPWQAFKMFGYPAPVAERDLPSDSRLIAYFPRDDAGAVDLWLIVAPATEPRAFRTKLTPGLKQALREVGQAMVGGGGARLQRGHPGHGSGIGSDNSDWVLHVESSLPAKE